MSRLGKTTDERLHYRTPEYLATRGRDFNRDSGERVPLKLSPGVLDEMHELRDARRSRARVSGRRGIFTQAETARVVELVSVCLSAGWTHSEIAKALGISQIDYYIKEQAA